MRSQGGAEIPILGVGTWKLQGRPCTEAVTDALGLGYRHVDTAQIYGNELAVGRGLRESGVAREEIFLATKVWRDALRRDALSRSVEESLARLATDYVDLLLVHWPVAETPLKETLDAMLELRERGRLRHIGVSNFPPSWIERAVGHAPIACNQVEYHPLLSQDRWLAALREHDVTLAAYCPLAHGAAASHPTLEAIGRAHDRTAAQVALRWLVQQEGVCVIPKAASREHLEENLRVHDFALEPGEMERIHAVARSEGRRTVDPDFAPPWER